MLDGYFYDVFVCVDVAQRGRDIAEKKNKKEKKIR